VIAPPEADEDGPPIEGALWGGLIGLIFLMALRAAALGEAR
jgi:uncharacterized membrane protein